MQAGSQSEGAGDQPAKRQHIFLPKSGFLIEQFLRLMSNPLL
jgi:hypothetical protein